MNMCLSCVCCHSLMLVLELHAIIFFSLQQDFATFSSTPCMVYRSLWASAPPLPALAARGNGPARRDWNTAVYLCVCLCVCVCVWVDGRQSVACLHFIYHSLGAVNLYRAPSMTISLLVGLHLLFSVFLSPCLAECASNYKSPRDAL